MSDTEQKKPVAPAVIAPPSILSKPTDVGARPGFRNPANSGSKAQQNKAKGKKK
jgi:hypothetical protein